MPRNLIESTAAIIADVEIVNAGVLEQVQRTSFTWTDFPGAMCLAANKAYYAEAIANRNVVAIVTPARIAGECPPTKALLLTDRCTELFYLIHNLAVHEAARTRSRLGQPQIDTSAQIAPTALVGPEVSIGRNTIVSDYCILQGPVEIGANCIFHPFVSIGTEGFFSKLIQGRKSHIRHYGGVRIGTNCILHAKVNVARSVNFNEFTEIESDVHVGVNANIGHDCHVGQGCDLAAWALLLGRSRIGSGTWIGANSVISNAVSVGRNVNVRVGSVVVNDLQDGSDVSGNFAIAHARTLRAHLKDRR